MKPPVVQPRRLLSIKRNLAPIMIFAVVAALLCWTAAWVFADRGDISNVLIVIGLFPMVVAVAAYLIVLITNIERK
jgi:hypothetical protein